MSVKDINIKNDTHYFFDDIINIKDFDPNNIKIDEKTNKNIHIYCIAYVTIKDSKHVIVIGNTVMVIVVRAMLFFMKITKIIDKFPSVNVCVKYKTARL